MDEAEGNELNVRAADALFQGDVPGVTSPVVHEHGRPPFLPGCAIIYK